MEAGAGWMVSGFAFDIWCYYLVHGAELDADSLPARLAIPSVRRAMEVLEMLTQNDLERERYETRLKAQRDQISFVLDAREEGLEVGLAQGRAQGRAEGQQEGVQQGELVGRIHAYQRLLKLALTPGEELLAFSPAELARKAEALEQQLGIGGA